MNFRLQRKSQGERHDEQERGDGEMRALFMRKRCSLKVHSKDDHLSADSDGERNRGWVGGRDLSSKKTQIFHSNFSKY